MNTTMETIILLVGQFGSSLFLWIGIALLAERATISAFQKRFIQTFSALLFPRSWHSARAGADAPFWLCPDVFTHVQKTADDHAHALDYRHSSVSGARGNVAHWVCSRPAARSVCSSCRNW